MTMKSHSLLIPHIAFFLSFLTFAFAHKYHENAALHSQFKGYFSKVYAFGDSYTDTGNGHILGGLISATSKYSTSMFGEPGSRLSDGRLVIDHLCEALSVPALPPYKDASSNTSRGVNFAVAGSTALSVDYFLKGKLHTLIWKRTPVSFKTQMDWYRNFQLQKGCKEKNEIECKGEMESTLFWIGAMGVDDYTRAIGSSVSLRWLAERSINHVCGLLKVLIESGAKYITIEGLPPVGCLPIAMAQSQTKDIDRMGCESTVNKAISIHNQILQSRLDKFRKMYPDRSILYADYWNAYLTILMNPKKYPFEESFKACCGERGGKLNFDAHSICGSPASSTCTNSSNYISWDGIHLTETMNQHLADMFLNQGFCQPSFLELIKTKSGI